MQKYVPVLLVLLAGLGLSGCGSSTAADMADVPAVRIADAALESGNPGVALRVLDRRIATDPHDVGALTRQGQANAMLGLYAAAEHSFRRALVLRPDDRAAQLGLAKALLPVNAAESERLFTAYLVTDPRNTDALNDLGVARDMQAHHAAAQQAYRQALAITPDMVASRQNLGLSLAMSGQAGAGAMLISQVVADGAADQRTRDDYALALTLDGHGNEAERMLRQDMSEKDASAALSAYNEFSVTTAPPSVQ